jgi:hypothetical protein
MRIYGTNGTALARVAPQSRRAASGTFAVANQEAASTACPAVSLRTLGGIDALIALQGIDDCAERRRHSLNCGRSALDILDEIKLGLLEGALDHSALLRLKSLSADLKGSCGDPGLDGVLAEISLRVEVELAKAGIR